LCGVRFLFRVEVVYSASISAGFRQPLEFRNLFRCQLDTVEFDLLAMLVDAAKAGMDIEVTTGNLGFENASLAIDPFFEAAEAAAITEIFPVFSGVGRTHGIKFRALAPLSPVRETPIFIWTSNFKFGEPIRCD